MKPTPQFKVGSMVAAPVAVFESGRAKVFGCEWGPDRLYQKMSGWSYLLAEISAIGHGIYWRASEEEIRNWQAA